MEIAKSLLKFAVDYWNFVLGLICLIAISLKTVWNYSFAKECENYYGVPQKYFTRDIITTIVYTFGFAAILILLLPGAVCLFFYRNEFINLIGVVAIIILYFDIMLPLISYALKKEYKNEAKIINTLAIIIAMVALSVLVLICELVIKNYTLRIIAFVFYFFIVIYHVVTCIRYYFLSFDAVKVKKSYEIITYKKNSYVIISVYNNHFVINKAYIDKKLKVLHLVKGEFELINMGAAGAIKYFSFKCVEIK